MSQDTSAAAEQDIDVLREVFGQTFDLTNPRSFGSRTSGFSDGNEGVQWNAGLDLQTGVAWLGVNLEGKAYNGWPIARLLQRELDDARLFATRKLLEEPDKIRVLLRRDAWGAGGSRLPNFKEHHILSSDVTLDQLDPSEWKRALIEAQGCLATPEGKRAKQEITLQDGHRIEIQVSPHLSFERSVSDPRSTDELRQAFRSVRHELQPLYDFVRERSA